MSYDGGLSWEDVDAVALTMPGPVVRVATMGADLGWSWCVSFAPGPPQTVALRFARGDRRAYGVWQLVDGRGRFTSAVANLVPGGYLRTLAGLKAHLIEHGVAELDTDDERNAA